MRHLMPVLFAAGAMILSSEASHAAQLAKLLPDDGATEDFFGSSVAVSGTTAIVGARIDGDNGPASGSAYLFDTTTGKQFAKLLADDGATFHEFGYSVAISGSTAIVGALMDDDNGFVSGSAYLFDTATGKQMAKLLPADGATTHRFGFSVAIDGAIGIVGAPGDDDNGNLSGSAYLFDAATGRQLFKLLPNDGAALDVFGISVGISGSTAIVSGTGSAYLFDITTGKQIGKLAANGSAVGGSVAISGTTAIVGVAADNGIGSGSAYLFDTTTGQQIAKLLPGDAGDGDNFGFSVAISGRTAIVGAYWDDDNGFRSGSAYLFDAATGRQLAKLLPSDGAADDNFGWSVAISGNTAIVGSSGDEDNGVLSGSAYLFDAAGTAGDESDDGSGAGDAGDGSGSGDSGDGNNNDNGESQNGAGTDDGGGNTNGGSSADDSTDSGEEDGQRDTPTDTGATTPGPSTGACPVAAAIMFLLAAVGLVGTRSRRRD